MAKLDKHFFDTTDIEREKWNETVKEAMDREKIWFDLENDSELEQKRVKVLEETDDELSIKCELCSAGGDWQEGTYYVRCQVADGFAFGIHKGQFFCLIPNKKQGNRILVKSEEKKGYFPPDAGDGHNDDFLKDDDRKVVWENMPQILENFVAAVGKEAEKKYGAMVERIASSVIKG